MPFGAGAGYAEELTNIRAEKAALMGRTAGLGDQPSDVAKGQGALFSGIADLIKAPGAGAKSQAEADQIRQSIENNTEAGLFMKDFFSGMMMPAPGGQGQVFKPEFRVTEENHQTPDLGALTQHLYATASKHALTPEAFGQSIEMMQKAAGYGSAVATEWMKSYAAIYEKQRLDELKQAKEDYKDASTQEGAKKALTQVGLAQQPAGEAIDLTKATMEGIGAGAAGSSANLEKYTVQFPGGSIATFAVPLGEQFVAPEGGVIIKPDTSKGMPAEQAAKAAGIGLWQGNWPKVQTITETYFGEGVGGLELRKNIAILTYAEGGTNNDLQQLYLMNRSGIETYLRLMSGAAIPPEEVKMAMGMFMPQMLDTRETIAFKGQQINKFLTLTHENIDPQGKYAKGKIPKEVLLDIAMQMAFTEPGEVSADSDVNDFIKTHK